MKLIILTGLVLFSQFSRAEQVTMNITNMGNESGQLALAVFSDPDAFPDNILESAFTNFYPLPSPLNQTVVTFDIKPGRYALATFLDKNKNQKLDKYIIGAPKERFGFSQNPSIGFSSPNFSECDFEVVKGKTLTLTINLIKMML